MRHPTFLIIISSFALAICQLHADFLLDDVMPKEDQKKTGVANLSMKQKIALESFLNQTFVLKSQIKNCPTPPPTNPKESLSLSISINNGQQLKLSDNSLWEIDPKHRETSSIWITPFPIQITPSNDPNYPVTLTNLTTGASVNAKQATSGTTTPTAPSVAPNITPPSTTPKTPPPKK